MAKLKTEQLLSRLNAFCRSTLDGAVGLCQLNHNSTVEIEHWLLKCLEDEKADIRVILDHFKIDVGVVLGEMMRAVERLRSGDTRPLQLSPQIFDCIREAWLLGSIDYGTGTVRSGHLLLALLTDKWLNPVLQQISSTMAGISVEKLAEGLPTIVAPSSESEHEMRLNAPASSKQPRQQGESGRSTTPALDQFTVDLTEQARQGRIDPIVGRDAEIRQLIDILMRRRQNNPVLVGEAGVGKTAVVEGFALRIANHDVPPPLVNVAVKALDLGLLQAGASVRGELENRLRSVIDEVKSSATPIILFIDEAHMLIGGNSSAMGEASNLLKPALARGELRTIAATTWSEYKEYFDKDAAMVRRFQLVKVEEPSEEKAILMIRGLVPTLTNHHQVEIRDDGVQAAVRLSKRYLSERQLPDKAVSVLDTTCARVFLSQSSTPAALEDIERKIDHLDNYIKTCERELTTGESDPDHLNSLIQQRTVLKEEWSQLTDRWKKEQTLVDQILKSRASLQDKKPGSAPPSDGDEPSTLPTKEQLLLLEKELGELQGQKPLIKPYVDSQAVAEVIAGWTGVPVGRMLSDEIQMVMNLESHLRERVVGQDHALQAVSQRVRISRANLTDPTRPTGVFLLVGPSGVGKTETAIALADLLYGGRQNLTIINMSEFKEEHKVSMLTGAPAGYVGYGKGGVLTEAIRRRPYNVLLLDEIEKAHPGVHDIFYQVFDKGMLRDGEGRDIDFKNSLIIMTSNAASDVIANLCADPETAPSPEGLQASLHEHLLKTFKPAFLGRTTIVPYFPLSKEVLANISRLQLKRVGDRIRENYLSDFGYSDDVVNMIVNRCTEVDSGARIIQQIISNVILPELSNRFLTRGEDEPRLKSVGLAIDGNSGELTYQ
ncbi:MAG: type VI secretion system ATPase TssH, partial [Planctomycetaceae bacterium]